MNTSPELTDVLSTRYASRTIKSRPDLLAEVGRLTAHLKPDISLVERVWLLKNDLAEPPACEFGRERKWVDGSVGYRFCGVPTKCACAKINHSEKISASKRRMTVEEVVTANEKRRNTVQAKHGVDHISQTEEWKQKREQTCLERYGETTNLKLEETKERIRQTCLKRYDHASPMSNATVQAKRIETSRERYGENYSVLQNRQRFGEIMRDRYGVEHALQHEEFRAARRRTNVERWGSANHMLNPACVEKMRQTNIERYGVPNINQVGYSEDDLRLVGDKEFFAARYAELGADGILAAYNISRAVVRNCLVKYEIPHDRNLTHPERIVHDILVRHVPDVVIRSRSVIPPYEVDFYVPEHSLAIEVCGLYWHGENQGKDRSYHLRKTDWCAEKNVRLLTVFDDELRNVELAASKITHLLQGSPRLCAARQTEIREISTHDAKTFLNDHHVQGYCKSQVKIGAFYNDDLVAVMTMGGLRAALGSKQVDGEWEILRIAAKGSVPGVASKMLTSFKRMHDPARIISYCDRRWGTGGVYRQMGMEFSHNTAPGYWYVEPRRHKRLHRYNFTKSKLVAAGHDPKLTEKEIMISLGYDRIWDCGHSKWVWERR